MDGTSRGGLKVAYHSVAVKGVLTLNSVKGQRDNSRASFVTFVLFVAKERASRPYFAKAPQDKHSPIRFLRTSTEAH